MFSRLLVTRSRRAVIGCYITSSEVYLAGGTNRWKAICSDSFNGGFWPAGMTD
jgi:hypothetical protein